VALIPQEERLFPVRHQNPDIVCEPDVSHDVHPSIEISAVNVPFRATVPGGIFTSQEFRFSNPALPSKALRTPPRPSEPVSSCSGGRPRQSRPVEGRFPAMTSERRKLAAFPVFMRVERRVVVIVGGGEEAFAK